MKKITGVILAGGAGTRLWPRSRAHWPKFLIKFGKYSLLGECFKRLESFIPAKNILVVTNTEHKYSVGEDISSINPVWPSNNIIAEPASKNTLPAAVIAAAKSLVAFGDEPMIICPSDHLIGDNAAFAATVRTAAAAARKGFIVLFGIKPARPETGYGYIKPGRRLPGVSRVRMVSKFVEKPPLDAARRIFKKGYLWNAGIFVVKPSVLLEEIRTHNPSFYSLAAPLLDGSGTTDSAIKKVYGRIPSVSIDYGVVEKSDRTAIMPLGVAWDDLGDWTSARRVYGADKLGNVFRGRVESVDTSNTVVMGSKRLVGVVGIKDAVIVDTPDALLVASASASQNVRDLVAKISGREEALRHSVVSRPWGEYEVLEDAPGYKVKIIRVLPGKKLSLQKHTRRSEHWLVVDGIARVTNGGSAKIVREGQMTHIPVRAVHRLENVSKKILEVIEISRGRYISEDDIIRIKDDFDRK